MPASKYKLWSEGKPVGVGVTGSIHVAMAGIAKKSTPAHPYIVANELVCCSLGRALLLPCPPGALMEHNGETYFFSLDFNLAGQSLPPAPAATIATTQEYLAWGITVFDVFVMNPDRHSGNLAYDATTKRVQIFDHSHAFLSPSGDVPTRLTACENQLAIGGHCLARELTSTNGLDDWTARVAQVPDYFIEGLIAAACEVGLPAADKQAVTDFVKRRRDNISPLLKANLSNFPKLPKAAP